MKYSVLFLVLLLVSLPNITFGKNPVRIGVVDTGLDLNDVRFKKNLCKEDHKDFTGRGIEDSHGHGTFIVGLIQKYAKNTNYCLVIVKFYAESNPDAVNSYSLLMSLKYLKDKNIKIVNLSGGGNGFSYREHEVLSQNRHIKFFVAAGNDGKDLDKNCSYYPACYKLSNIFPVGNLNKDGTKASSSNYGSIIKNWEIGEDVSSTMPGGKVGVMSGSSMSTGIFTGKYIYENFR